MMMYQRPVGVKKKTPTHDTSSSFYGHLLKQGESVLLTADRDAFPYWRVNMQ